MSSSSYRFIDRRLESNRAREDALTPRALSPGLYSTPRNSGQLDWYRPRPYRYADISVTLNDYDWYDLLAISRQLFAQIGNLAAAIIQKNMYAVGEAWKPQYVGRNAAWGEEATEWLEHEWYPQCDVRGGIFDFTRNLFLSGLSWDVDGDDLVIFAKDSDTGFPLLKHVAAYSVGTRSAGGTSGDIKSPLKDGPFKGARCENGVILDRDDRFLGVNLVGRTPEDSQQIPAGNCQFLYEPEWRSSSRGIPRIARPNMDWQDVQDIDTFLKRIVKKEASVGIIHTTATGDPGLNTDLIVERTNTGTDTNQSNPPLDVRVERRLGGEDFYMQAGVGEEIKSFYTDRPGSNSEAFVQRIERRGLAAVGWFYELLDSSKIGGANVRLIQDQARHSIRARQNTLRLAAGRKVKWAISVAMESGRIKKNYDGNDWMKWHFSTPAEITVDAGYDEKADQDNLALGTTTLAAIAQKKGRLWQNDRRQRLTENHRLIDDANDLVEYSASIGQVLTFREALDMTQRQGANQRLEPKEEKATQ